MQHVYKEALQPRGRDVHIFLHGLYTHHKYNEFPQLQKRIAVHPELKEIVEDFNKQSGLTSFYEMRQRHAFKPLYRLDVVYSNFAVFNLNL